MEKVTKIRWVVAHDPLYLFLRAAEDFQAEVNARSKDHKIEVEIMTPTQYADRYGWPETENANNDEFRFNQLYTLMQEGKIEMSQLVTTNLAAKFNKNMHVLDLPFLFKDHDHATRALEGEPGQKILNSFTPESKIRGLAFTYSGGFRCLPVSAKIKSLAELSGQPIRAGMNPVARETFAAIGVEPKSMELAAINTAVEQGEIIGGESAFPRIYPCEQNTFSKTVLDTGHSLFLTSIIVSEGFWNGLSPELQQIISEAAVAAGRTERQRSIEDGEDTKVKLAAEGIDVVKLSDKDQEEFKARTEYLYDKFNGWFSPGLVDSIKYMH
jgi:TRAP-type C4-dicarboxylate transport system substrate-binding protein